MPQPNIESIIDTSKPSAGRIYDYVLRELGINPETI